MPAERYGAKRIVRLLRGIEVEVMNRKQASQAGNGEEVTGQTCHCCRIQIGGLMP